VLVPLSEAPAVTEDERKAAEAKAGLGKQLVGHWKVEGAQAEPKAKPKAKPKADNVITRLLSSRIRTNTDVEATFQEDGAASITGGMFANFGLQTFTWECVEQGDKVLTFAIYMDGVEFMTARAKFVTDDQLKFVGTPYFPQDATFVRVSDEPAADAAAETPAAAEPAAEVKTEAKPGALE
jgi:hypothetical protein